MSHTKLLQNLYLFKNLTSDQLDLIEGAAELKTFSAGDNIFSQNDEAKALYVIQYGSVRIHQNSNSGDTLDVAVLGTGSHFGEMGLLDGETRSASATVVEKSDIIVIEYEKLNEILNSNMDVAVNFYRELAHFLCGRLRITTNDLSFARSQNLRHF